MGCFSENFQEGTGLGLPRHSGKRPIKEGKRPINVNGQFLRTLPLWKTAPLKKPLNAPFLNGLFSSGFSRGKTAPEDEIGETPH